jgi:alcohol dehydrogenase class IV
MRHDFSLSYPNPVIFGNGALSKLPSVLPPKSKVLLVTGRHAQKSGLQKTALDALAPFNVVTVEGVSPEPPLSEVDKLIRECRREHVTAVVAAGGGSVIDAAKAAAALAPSEAQSVKEVFDGLKEITGRGLFFIAAPTTAGTGAEITMNSVLTDPETKIKKSIRHPAMIPDAAVIDPLLTVSCPPGLTAASGLDALTQAVESLITPGANPASAALAERAIKLILESLPKAFREPGNIDARTGMAEGSLLSAMSFSQCGLGAVHALAHPVGSLLGVPHGLACAILLVPVLRFNRPACEKEMAGLSKLTGGADFVSVVETLRAELGVPDSFSSYKLDKSQFPFIIKNCRSGSMKCNPRQMSDAEAGELLSGLL